MGSTISDTADTEVFSAFLAHVFERKDTRFEQILPISTNVFPVAVRTGWLWHFPLLRVDLKPSIAESTVVSLNALLIFESWTVIMGGVLAPVLLGEPVGKILLSVGFSMFTFLFALFALHSSYNAGLCSIGMAFAVMAISITLVAIASVAVMCVPPLTRGVFIAFLALFLFVDSLVLMCLLGYISKNVE
ncbi:MAG: hypothetical protein E3J35_01045 [Methanomassiliicoccales archaeon]|nr:MAG: hypothetical protein E3J35_01045 [Methanomassiliicoccales archaeon]